VVPLKEGEYSDEDDLIEAERPTAERLAEYSNSSSGYVRFVDNSLFRKEAKRGDLVIAVWTPSQKSNRATVFAPEPILHRKDKGGVTHLFIEEYVDRDETAVSFTSFYRLWQREYSAKAPGRRSTRELPVDVLEKFRVSWPSR
jgi:hypothetical protein